MLSRSVAAIVITMSIMMFGQKATSDTCTHDVAMPGAICTQN